VDLHQKHNQRSITSNRCATARGEVMGGCEKTNTGAPREKRKTTTGQRNVNVIIRPFRNVFQGEQSSGPAFVKKKDRGSAIALNHGFQRRGSCATKLPTTIGNKAVSKKRDVVTKKLLHKSRMEWGGVETSKRTTDSRGRRENESSEANRGRHYPKKVLTPNRQHKTEAAPQHPGSNRLLRVRYCLFRL